MPNIDKAREWANNYLEGAYLPTSDRALAAAKVIKSLPDHWVATEELREILGQSKEDADSGLYRSVDELITSKLPSLLELVVERGHDVNDYLFAWVDTEEGIHLVTRTFGLDDRHVYTMDSRGYRFTKDWDEVTPRDDLTRLEWANSTSRKPYLFGGTSTEKDSPLGSLEHTKSDLVEPSDQRRDPEVTSKETSAPDEEPAPDEVPDDWWICRGMYP